MKNYKSFHFAFAAAAVMGLSLTACGDEVTEVTEVHKDGMAVLESGEKLSKQACDTTNVGEMLFVMDSTSAFICDGESWQTLKGEDGDNGASCTAKPVKNKAGLEGLEMTCGETVVDTIWNGKNGESGTSCTASENDEGGFDLVCDGKTVGTIKNGKNGESGTSCTASENDEGGFDLVCDGKTVGTIKNGENGESGTSCTAKSVENDAGLKGLEVTCGEKVVDTIWNGEKGEKGNAGMSAYEIAVENGFDGTEAEWLESMKGPFLQDKRDGKIYKTVKIGDQVWMAENLNYSVNPGEQSWCGGGEKETENEGDCSVYGRLYTWAAAVDSVALANDEKNPLTCGYGVHCILPSVVQGVCPEGWHLPDTTEWNTLIDFAGGMASAGKMLKASTGWDDNNGSSGNGMDAFGFSALPAGRKNDPTGSFVNVGAETAFMSAVQRDQSGTNNNGKNAFLVILGNAYEKAAVGAMAKTFATSVRCIKD